MEPISGAVIAAGKAAKAADESKLLSRLVGPVFDEMGLNLAERYRNRNAAKVARRAARRLGEEQLGLPGAVHPRVAHRILDDGSFVHEDVMQEYLAGLLAGSRTENGEDDRAAYYVDLVASMPSTQVKLHHAIYAAVATAEPGQDFGLGPVLGRHTVVTDLDIAATAIDVPSDLDREYATAEALLGLHREGLIETYGIGTASELGLSTSDTQLLLAMPTTMGCFLALWAHGLRDADVTAMGRILPCDFDEPGPAFTSFELKEL